MFVMLRREAVRLSCATPGHGVELLERHFRSESLDRHNNVFM
jgi:hypothetical protein